jgi:catalase
MDNWNHRVDDQDYYTQAGDLFRIMDKNQQQVLFENTARSVGGADLEVQKRHVANCMKADSAYGEGVAKALNLPSN